MLAQIKLPKELYFVGAGLLAVAVGWKLMKQASGHEEPEVDEIKEAILHLRSKQRVTLCECLASSPRIREFLCEIGEIVYSNSYTKQKLQLSQFIVMYLVKIVSDLQNSAYDLINPSQLISCLEEESEFFVYKEQQVCHELLNILLRHIDALLDCQREYSLKSFCQDATISINPIKGRVQSHLFCPVCEHKYMIKVESSYGLSLDIRSYTITTLQAALDGFFTSEVIDGYTCTKCSLRKLQKQIEPKTEAFHQVDQMLKQSTLDFQEMQDMAQQNKLHLSAVKTKVLKVTELQMLPDVQVIHFKRLTVDMYGEVIKIQKHIAFDDQITLKSNTNTKQYQLTGVIAHFGGESFGTASVLHFVLGHYITFRRSTYQGYLQWFFISDAKVKRVDESVVFSAQPYILFYES